MAKLRGVFTALVTPFNQDRSVDYGALDAFVDKQLEEGIDGLVPCGTTGESATMTAQERQSVIAAVVKRVGGKRPVIAGAGSQDTAVAIDHQKRAKDTGADFALVATPFYNKPTPNGLFQHYEALLQAVDIPIIMYNVPGRTACDMLPSTVARIAKLEGIAGIKEATADLLRITDIRNQCGEDFSLLSGDDFTCTPFTMLGGDGVISVCSNVAVKDTVKMVHAALEGDLATARETHHRMQPLLQSLFFESNPIPVKAVVAMQGLVPEIYRPPLCKMEPENRARLEKVVKAGGWV